MTKCHFLVFCFCLPFLLFAQKQPLRVNWDIEVRGVPFKKGKNATLVFTAKIPQGYHIYSSQQPEKAVLPLSVTLDKDAQGIVLKELKEEGKREEIFDEVFNAKIAQYGDELILRQNFKVKSKKQVIKGSITYQLCNEDMCVPERYEFSLP